MSSTTFDPKAHTIQIKRFNKKTGETTITDYLPCQWRIYWFRLENPKGSVESKLTHYDPEKGLAVFEAYVQREDGGSARMYGSETASDWGDYLEKANTKALARALAVVGYGSQFAESEFDEGERIADSPVERTAMANTRGTGNHTTTTQKPVRNGVQSRLNTIYGIARERGKFTPRKGSEQADFLAWVSSLFPEQSIKTAEDVKEEMMTYLEEYCKDVVA